MQKEKVIAGKPLWHTNDVAGMNGRTAAACYLQVFCSFGNSWVAGNLQEMYYHVCRENYIRS
jgi:hypothetical protein